MSNVDLNIVLKLLDEASDQIKKSLGDVTEETKKVGTESKKSTGETKAGFEEASKEIKKFRTNVIAAVAIMTALYQSVKTYSRYNEEARAKTDEFERTVEKVKVGIGRLADTDIPFLGKSMMDVLNQSAEGWGMLFNVIASGKVDAPTDDLVEGIVSAEQSLRAFKQEQSDTNTLYLDGQIAASDYYTAITDAEYNVQMVRAQSMQQMQELATLEMQISNESFMHAQRLTQEKINLLQFYQQTYNTAHQGMAAFTVMLGNTIQTNLSKALVDVTMNVHNSRDAFKQLEKAMIQAILNFMAQKLVAWALEKTLLAGTVAATSAAAAELASAWAPAAVGASIATLGGAAAVGTTAYGASLATSLMMATASSAAAKTAGASISVESQTIGGGQVIDQSAGFGGAQADGGDYMVSRPTWFLAGEAGPERATFTPIGKDQPQSKTIVIEINIDRPTVSNRDDIDYLAEQVSQRLAREVERIR